MKFSGDINAFKDERSRAVGIPVTDEIREKWSDVAGKIVDLLIASTDTPVEARMVLHHVLEAFDKTFGIKGVVCYEKKDREH